MRKLLTLCVVLLALYIPQPVLSEADGPDYWAVTGTTEKCYLNLRKGPSKSFSVVGRIPGNYKKLENLGCYPDFTFAEWAAFDSNERAGNDYEMVQSKILKHPWLGLRKILSRRWW